MDLRGLDYLDARRPLMHLHHIVAVFVALSQSSDVSTTRTRRSCRDHLDARRHALTLLCIVAVLVSASIIDLVNITFPSHYIHPRLKVQYTQEHAETGIKRNPKRLG